MGKYIKKKDLDKSLLESSYMTRIKVTFCFNKQYHTEYFEAPTSDIEKAKELGLLTFNENGYANYLDWKPPSGGGANVEGGLKYVERWSSDEKYIYAHTPAKRFSLPKYLENKIDKNINFIFFGKRVYDGN